MRLLTLIVVALITIKPVLALDISHELSRSIVDLRLQTIGTVRSTDPHIIDMHSVPPIDGFYSDGGGTYLDYCSVGGCLVGPKMLAQSLFSAATRLPAVAQEIGVAFNFINRTGYAPNWMRLTRYTKSLPSTPTHTSDVSNDNGIYRNKIENCQSSASGMGPTGRGVDIVDGSCHWMWISEGLNGSKSGVSLATTIYPGGGAAWGRVEDFSVRSGVKSIVAYANEEDCNNENQDSYAGAAFFMLCHFQGGGAKSTFPVFAYNYVGSGAVNSGSDNPFGAHYGWYFSGNPGDVGSVVKDADLASADNASIVLEGLAGRAHTMAFILDASNSGSVLKATGTHDAGLNLSEAIFKSGLATAIPAGTYHYLAGGTNPIGFNAITKCLTYGRTNSGTDYIMAACDEGGMSTSTLNLKALRVPPPTNSSLGVIQIYAGSDRLYFRRTSDGANIASIDVNGTLRTLGPVIGNTTP